MRIVYKLLARVGGWALDHLDQEEIQRLEEDLLPHPGDWNQLVSYAEILEAVSEHLCESLEVSPRKSAQAVVYDFLVTLERVWGKKVAEGATSYIEGKAPEDIPLH